MWLDGGVLPALRPGRGRGGLMWGLAVSIILSMSRLLRVAGYDGVWPWTWEYGCFLGALGPSGWCHFFI